VFFLHLHERAPPGTTHPSNSTVERNNATGWEVLGAAEQGLLMLSVRSIRRYRCLEMFSNSPRRVEEASKLSLIRTGLLLLLILPAGAAEMVAGANRTAHTKKQLARWDAVELPSSSHVPSHTDVKSRITRRLAVRPVSPGSGTLQAELDAASDGDELVLADGMYTGSGDDVLEINKDITIRAQNAGQAILDGEDTRRVIKVSSGTVDLEGLSIINGNADVSARR
jgi:hypothetical protein